MKQPTLSILFDGLLFPLGKKSPAWGILLASLLTGALILFSYRFLSWPEKNRLAKDRIKANILALRIYKDFPQVILRSFLGSLWMTCRYLALNMIPLLMPLPFLILLYLHMDLRFGYRPLEKNETFIIKAKFNSELRSRPVELLQHPAIGSPMNPVWIPKLREIDWKVNACSEGVASLRFLIGDQVIHKEVVIGKCYRALPSTIHTSKFLHFILGDEPLLSKELGVSSISFSYPRRLLQLQFIYASWLIYYILLVLLFVLVFKKRLGIEF